MYPYNNRTNITSMCAQVVHRTYFNLFALSAAIFANFSLACLSSSKLAVKMSTVRLSFATSSCNFFIF
eukprot:m.108143 g.108143  ORF g.108143 m.108143 type:complete len:68 (+) comp13950_c0_seq1:102-305(+)